MRIPGTFRMPSIGILDKGFLGILLVVIIYSVHDRLGIQPFWDEPKIYLRPLFNMLDDPMAYFRGTITPRDRPIGLNFFYAPFLWIFGESMYFIRILSSFYFLLGLFFFYLALRMERLTAFLILALFIMIPIVRVYIPQLVGDPQLFSLFALYFFLLTKWERNFWPLIATGFLAGLMREPAIALVPASLAYFYLQKRKLNPGDICISFAPLLGLSVHLLRNFLRSGELLNHVTIQSGDLDLLAGLDVRYVNIVEILFGTYRLLPLLIVSIVILAFNWRKLRLTPEIGFSLALVVSYIAVFSGLWICLPRYFLPSIPFLIYLLVAPVLTCLPSGKSKAAFIFFAITSSLVVGVIKDPLRKPFPRGFGPQDTMNYPAMAKIHHEVIVKAKEHLSAGSSIATGWPFLEILTSTRIGYGPIKNFNLFVDSQSNPDAIIWSNFPQKPAWSYVEAQLSTANYEETGYSSGPYQVKLFLKKR